MGRPKQFNREGVLDRAIPVFWKQGFANTTVQDLEEATGVNKSGLYSEFKDKEDLFLASLERYAQTRGAEILTAQPLGWGNIERFLRLGFGCDDDQRGCFAVNSMRELAGLPTEAQEIISSSQQKLTRLLIKNIEAEEPKLEASTIADVVLTFFHGFCIAQNLKSGKASSDRKIRNLMQVVRNL
jgi:AcrR family transcriptional regulator